MLQGNPVSRLRVVLYFLNGYYNERNTRARKKFAFRVVSFPRALVLLALLSLT